MRLTAFAFASLLVKNVLHLYYKIQYWPCYSIVIKVVNLNKIHLSKNDHPRTKTTNPHSKSNLCFDGWKRRQILTVNFRTQHQATSAHPSTPPQTDRRPHWKTKKWANMDRWEEQLVATITEKYTTQLKLNSNVSYLEDNWLPPSLKNEQMSKHESLKRATDRHHHWKINNSSILSYWEGNWLPSLLKNEQMSKHEWLKRATDRQTQWKMNRLSNMND